MDARRKRRGGWLAAVALAATAAVAGCGSGYRTPPSTAPLLEAGYAGTERTAPTTGPGAQRDKAVWLVSCARVHERCAGPATGFEEAAGELGWDVTVVDDLDASGYSAGIRAAIAAGADGIVLGGVDCELATQALDAALLARIPTVAYGSVDCDDPTVGRTRRFRAEVNMGPGHEAFADHARASAATKAAWVVDELGGDGTVLDVRLAGSPVARVVGEGFADGMEGCEGCEVVPVEATVADVLSGAFPERLAAALAGHPEAGAVHLPVDDLAPLAARALAGSGRDTELAVVAGEGTPATLDLVRSGAGADAALAVPAAWTGWAAADTLNRVLAGDRTIPDSGIGWTLVDRGHNLPAGDFEPATDFRAALRAVWSGSSTVAA